MKNHNKTVVLTTSSNQGMHNAQQGEDDACLPVPRGSEYEVVNIISKLPHQYVPIFDIMCV